MRSTSTSSSRRWTTARGSRWSVSTSTGSASDRALDRGTGRAGDRPQAAAVVQRPRPLPAGFDRGKPLAETTGAAGRRAPRAVELDQARTGLGEPPEYAVHLL